MRVLVLSGEGPYFKNNTYLNGSLFDPVIGPGMDKYFGELAPLRLDQLSYTDPSGTSQPLMRSKRGLVPHLTTWTLDSILAETGVEYEMFPLQAVWDRDREPSLDPDVVLLSTTFICDNATLRLAIEWIDERCADTLLVVGGQYSNLKYAQILRRYPAVKYIVRGDAEIALPALLRSLKRGGNLSGIPNLVMRAEDGGLRQSPIEYVDLDAHPSPSYRGRHPVVPYESMRGCPFSCRFCSFPAASPKWRYKSAMKIRDDWRRYAEKNEASHVRAMDSTFTVPPTRLRELLPMLVDGPTTWEGYARANALNNPATIGALAAARCKTLSIGFESMSPLTLEYMNKRVTAEQNRRAHQLLKDSPVGYRVSFMVGYPGETPEEYERTHQYLVEEYSGHFMLSVFSLTDETMPVWQDVDRFQIKVHDPENPDYSWEHVGMSVHEAKDLIRRTLDEVRGQNDDSVLLLWQTNWQTPLVPHLNQRTNMRLEKLVERLAMVLELTRFRGHLTSSGRRSHDAQEATPTAAVPG